VRRLSFFVQVVFESSLVWAAICLSFFSWPADVGRAVEIAGGKVDYVRDIRPILSDNCYACHGPAAKHREGDLQLDQQDSVLGEAASGEHAIVPGKPDESELLRRIVTDDEDELMPPADSGKSLTVEQKSLVRQWIEQGAEWQEHWSFVTPTRPALPEVKNNAWVGNAIDAFVLARLEKESLQPTSAADKETLLRRVTFDLTGLPPTIEEMDAFLADDVAGAYERAVDRLLQSPHYGEHMTRFWLDAARYGDTHGLHLDNYREIWPYRDWVVRAFNRNMPFDQFTVEQLAGDLLPNATLEQKIATGFCRCNVSTSEGGSIKEEVYVRNVVDRVTTTGTVFLGLTFECTRCHDHKFDPLTMHDFYSMFAYFNSIDGPALDGNVMDTQPSIAAPSPEQVAEMEKAESRIAGMVAEKVASRESGLQQFDAWLTQQHQSIAGGATVSYSVPSEGLVGYYPLELQAEGKVADQISTEKGGNAEGKVTATEGRYGGGVKLAEQGYLDLGDVFDVEHDKKFSLSVWVNLPADAEGAVLSKIGERRRGYAIRVKNGRIYFELNHRDDYQAIRVETGTKELANAGWHHLLVSYDGSSKASGVDIYVDGKLQPLDVKKNSLTDRANKRTVDSGDAHFMFGRLTDGNGFAEGQLDEFRFYDRKLSQAEVVEVMLADAIYGLVQQASEETSPEQLGELQEYFLYRESQEYVELAVREDQLRGELNTIKQGLPISLVYQELAEPREAFMLTRGEYDQKGEKVERATPGVLPAMPEGSPQNRLGLAQWLVDRQNPLTSRVAVNRFWAQAFGIGIVKTAEDFGSQGDVPSHPALLNWLAVEFIESGWDIKGLLKTIVMSNTYRQSSRMNSEIVERDPENRLMTHGPRYRLDAEMLRDQALSVSELLSNQLGGPGVKPPQPDGLWFAVGYSGSNTVRFVADTEPEKVHRRTLYTFFKRTSPPPQMSTFDAPSREACVVRRERTNTPLQALLLLNDPQYMEAARALAERVLRLEDDSFENRLQTMVRLCAGHSASQATIDELRGLYDDQLNIYKEDVEAAEALINVGLPMKTEPADASELAAWTMVANVVLNLDEVVTKN